MPNVPKLPATVVTILGLVATVLALVEPTLPEQWHAVGVGVLALLTLLGVNRTQASINGHTDRVVEHVTAQYEPKHRAEG